MNHLKNVPVSYFYLDPDSNLLEQSDEAVLQFGSIFNMRDIVDQGSLNKFNRMMATTEKQSFELVLSTKTSPYMLFDCIFQWNEGVGHLICIEKSEQIKKLEGIVSDHRKRLADTNFDLLEQKEELEKRLLLINQLSAPFIQIGENTGLIMLFGELTGSLIKVNGKELLHRVFGETYEHIIFDFSGIGDVHIDGIDDFNQLLKSFQVMGVSLSIVGVKPEHSSFLNKKDLNIKGDVSFRNNLYEMIETNLH